MNFERHDIEWNPDKISRFWDYISSNAAMSCKFFGLRSGDHVAAVINKSINFKELHSILDLSSGKGDVLSSCFRYLKGNQRAYATDYSVENVDCVNERFKDNPLFGGAHRLQDYPSQFSDSSFDLIIITEVVEHLNDEDLASMLSEANRLLVTGGYICITTPNDEVLEENHVMCPDCGCVFHRWQHVRTWTITSLQQLLAKYSFQPKLIRKLAWDSVLKKRILLNLAVKLNLIAPNGLVYIGKKVSS